MATNPDREDLSARCVACMEPMSAHVRVSAAREGPTHASVVFDRGEFVALICPRNVYQPVSQ